MESFVDFLSGLRCPVPLRKGQFIDTYRGEVITNAEAEKREAANKGKDSYLYSLDKFQGKEDSDDYIPTEELYVVDGEFVGGSTRFMNHSCKPNCLQFVACIGRGDYKVYELPFFALEDIPAGSELTFDYKDNEDDEDASDEDTANKERIECRCGEDNCKKYLWV